MVIEKLLDAKKVEKKPILLFFYSIICAVFSIVLSYVLFPEYSAILFIAFGTILLIPVVVKVIEYEDMMTSIKNMNPFDSKNKEKNKVSFNSFFINSKKIFVMYGYIFLAFFLVFLVSYVVVPNTTSKVLFQEQVSVLSFLSDSKKIYADNVISNDFCDTNPLFELENTITDCKVINLNHDKYVEYLIFENSTSPTKLYYTETGKFGDYKSYIKSNLFFSDFWKLILVLLMSLILGAGSLFALIFLASMCAVFFGEFIFVVINFFTHLSYVSILSSPIIALQGIFLLLAYLCSIVSGGVISLFILRNKYKDKQFLTVVIEAVLLFLLGLIFLYISVLIRSVV